MITTMKNRLNTKVRLCAAPGFRYAASGLLAFVFS